MGVSRADLRLVTLVVEGRDCGVWDAADSGDLSSDVQRYRAGGQKFDVVVGGPPTADTKTLSRGWDRERDSDLFRFLAQRRGHGRTTITETDLDEDYNTWGRPKVFSGVLESVNRGDYGSNESDVETWELVVAIDAEIA